MKEKKLIWSGKAPVSIARVNHAVTSYNGKIYVAGGNNTINSVEIYDVATDSWTFGPNLSIGRTKPAFTGANGKLYVYGGEGPNGGRWAPEVEEYDPVSNRWSRKNNWSSPRQAMAASSYQRKIYVAGGRPGYGPTRKTFEVYDPVADTWTSKSAMPQDAMNSAGVFVNGKFYVIGGQSRASESSPDIPLSTVQEYDPTTNTWAMKSDIPVPWTDGTAAVVDNKIFIIGGWNKSGQVTKIYSYNPGSDTWKVVSYTGFTPRVSMGTEAPVINGAIYAISGAVYGQQATNLVEAGRIPGLKTKGWRHERNDIAGSNFYEAPSTVRTAGTFVEKWSSAASGEFDRVLTGDVTGDSKLEIIITKGSTLKILSASGQELQNIHVSSSDCWVTMIEDVDGDGIDDIGVGNRVNGSTLRIFFYNGQGNLLKTLSKSGGYDSSMWPETRLSNGDIVVSEIAGFSLDPRGYTVFNYTTGTEKWHYDVGPAGGITSISDMNNDGKLEFTNLARTVHNGASGDGYNHNGTYTTDGDFFTIIVDEDGNEEFTLGYDNSGGGESSNGHLINIFTDLDRDGTIEILALEGHDNTYRGTSQLHLINPITKSIYKTFSAEHSNTIWYKWLGKAGWAIADINQDGKDEIIASNGGLRQYILDDNLNVLETSDITGWVELVNDLDGDGNLEVVMNDRAMVRVLNANLKVKWTYTFGGEINRIIVSDNDGNGKNELVVLAKDKLYVLEGSGGSTGVLNDFQNTPIRIALLQNYPNPFNPATQITYDLPQNGHVRIEIYDLLGNHIRTLVKENQASGHYSVRWDSRDDNGVQVPSGVYVYRLTAGEYAEGRKMLLLR